MLLHAGAHGETLGVRRDARAEGGPSTSGRERMRVWRPAAIAVHKSSCHRRRAPTGRRAIPGDAEPRLPTRSRLAGYASCSPIVIGPMSENRSTSEACGRDEHLSGDDREILAFTSLEEARDRAAERFWPGSRRSARAVETMPSKADAGRPASGAVGRMSSDIDKARQSGELLGTHQAPTAAP